MFARRVAGLLSVPLTPLLGLWCIINSLLTFQHIAAAVLVLPPMPLLFLTASPLGTQVVAYSSAVHLIHHVSYCIVLDSCRLSVEQVPAVLPAMKP